MDHSITLEQLLVKTPGLPITGSIDISSSYEDSKGKTVILKLSDYKTSDLFPPTVLTYYDQDRETINVNAMVLLPFGKIDKNSFNVTQQYVYGAGGENQLNLYISYYADEVITNEYIQLFISFKTDPVYFDGNKVTIESTQTFFRNRDPKTSRGTITTVKRPM